MLTNPEDFYLSSSTVCGGLGLFTKKDIPINSKVWALDLQYDRAVPDLVAYKEFVNKYAFFDYGASMWVCCLDDARFINHSEFDYNIMPVPVGLYNDGMDLTTRDVKAGEEILINYNQIHSGSWE